MAGTLFVVLNAQDEAMAVSTTRAQAQKDKRWAEKHGTQGPYRIERRESYPQQEQTNENA